MYNVSSSNQGLQLKHRIYYQQTQHYINILNQWGEQREITTIWIILIKVWTIQTFAKLEGKGEWKKQVFTILVHITYVWNGIEIYCINILSDLNVYPLKSRQVYPSIGCWLRSDETLHAWENIFYTARGPA